MWVVLLLYQILLCQDIIDLMNNSRIWYLRDSLLKNYSQNSEGIVEDDDDDDTFENTRDEKRRGVILQLFRFHKLLGS